MKFYNLIGQEISEHDYKAHARLFAAQLSFVGLPAFQHAVSVRGEKGVMLCLGTKTHCHSLTLDGRPSPGLAQTGYNALSTDNLA